ncbi:MAG: hypothetical protein M1833_004913 [Piccolia ochrophora]|nr:MAG: hypothetical protein M1833_004913 [Piccolia ochrophora]
MDPSTHRKTAVLLARLTRGRCLSVRYRLSPQAVFPAALLDCLVAYLYLLYPPPSALHAPVPASQIVITGDSAGGGLAFSLLQLLLTMHRLSPGPHPPTIRFNATTVPLPLPAGVAANSGWFDLTHSLPSVTANYKTDYLPPPCICPRTHFPPCRMWPSPSPGQGAPPSSPPRDDIYTDTGSQLLHPLVSPVAAESWAGSPPLFLVTGDEQLADESGFVAARAAAQHVPVVYERYETMPHCFAMTLPWLDVSRRCLRSWAGFATECVARAAATAEGEADSLRTSGTVVGAGKGGGEREVDVRAVSGLTLDGVRARMSGMLDRRGEVLASEGKLLAKL